MVYFLHMKLNLNAIQTQKQILAPFMQQSIEVLLLPLAELNMSIEKELQENPLLEIDEEKQDAQDNKLDAEIRKKIERMNRTADLPSNQQYSDDEIFEERPIKKNETLEDKLLQQLRIEFSDPLKIKIGELIIGDIDQDGYLTITCEEIAEILNIRDLTIIEGVLHTIQTFEPVGIAARNLKECLLTQAEEKYNKNGALVYQIINDFLKDLSLKKYAKIARKLNASAEEVKEAARFIISLDPKPARNHRPLSPNIYIRPDVFIIPDNKSNYLIHINKEGVPPLRFNPVYKQMLRQNNLTPEDKKFVREKIKNALLFIKSIEQRGQTIKGIAQYITDKQKNFFTQGHMALVPLTLKDVAQALDRNESTISRAINNKYIDTPQGLYPMKFFFSQAIETL